MQVASMAGLSFDCDWRYAMNIDPQGRARAGYLMTWSGVGGLTLSADITVVSPFTSTGATVLTSTKVVCVGVIEKFSFAGEEDDPIRIAAYISTANAASLGAKIASGITTTKFKFSYVICDYDIDKKKWFECAYVQNNGSASAVVDTMDGALQLFVNPTPERIRPDLDIALCRVEFQAGATSTSANLQFATGASSKVVKAWGGE